MVSIDKIVSFYVWLSVVRETNLALDRANYALSLFFGNVANIALFVLRYVFVVSFFGYVRKKGMSSS